MFLTSHNHLILTLQFYYVSRVLHQCLNSSDISLCLKLYFFAFYRGDAASDLKLKIGSCDAILGNIKD